MKRSEALLDLSREHHQALVFARRIALCPHDPDHHEALRCAVLTQLAPDLDEHFSEEERNFLPRIGDAHPEEIARTLDEHQRLRALLNALREGDNSALKPFGALLAEHVRFEERELFPMIEVTLRSSV